LEIKYLVRIKNNQINLNIETHDDNLYIKNYYKELLKDEIKNNIQSSFKNLSEIYEFNLNEFNLNCIEILKSIYNNPYSYNTDIINNKEEIAFLKKYKFIRYDKYKNLYKMTKKTKLFLFEFNANFWLGKYEKVIEKYSSTLKNNFEYSWKNIQNDFQKELNKEIKYMNNLD